MKYWRKNSSRHHLNHGGSQLQIETLAHRIIGSQPPANLNHITPPVATSKQDDEARISALFARIDLQVTTNKALASSLTRIRAETAAKFNNAS